MRKSIKQMVEGFNELSLENEILRKHATELLDNRGKVAETINLFHPKSLNLCVSEIRVETPSTSTLRLVSEDGYLPPFQAGQYINLFVEIDGIRTSRPYSISSSPSQIGYYDITVSRVNEGFVSAYLLDEVQVKDKFCSTAPTGNFYYNPLFHGQELVFLAGGSGITPFMSMIREVTDRCLDRQIHLIYGNRNQADIPFDEELRDRAHRHKNLKVSHVISEPSAGYDGLSGFISAELLKNEINALEKKTFYVCGPEAMYS